MSNDHSEDTFIVERVTNKDVYRKLNEQDKILKEILDQAKLTNGRVTTLEKKSVGIWMSKNPVRFAACVAGFILILIAISANSEVAVSTLLGVFT